MPQEKFEAAQYEQRNKAKEAFLPTPKAAQLRQRKPVTYAQQWQHESKNHMQQ